MKKLIVLFILLFVVFGFYWLEIRPAQIRIDCANSNRTPFLNPVTNKVEGGGLNEKEYKACLLLHGLIQ